MICQCRLDRLQNDFTVELYMPIFRGIFSLQVNHRMFFFVIVKLHFFAVKVCAYSLFCDFIFFSGKSHIFL